MMAVAAAGTPGIEDEAARAALIYLLAYMFTNLGAFAVVLSIEKDDGTGTQSRRLQGLGRSRPLLAAMMAFFMLSLTGIPLTGGFIGKWFVFLSALNAGLDRAGGGRRADQSSSARSTMCASSSTCTSPTARATRRQARPSTSTWATYIAFAGTLLLGVAPLLVTALSDRVALLASIIH